MYRLTGEEMEEVDCTNYERKVKEISACAEEQQDIYTSFWRIVNYNQNKAMSGWHMFKADCWKEAYQALTNIN